jgi:hypothetical protein
MPWPYSMRHRLYGRFFVDADLLQTGDSSFSPDFFVFFHSLWISSHYYFTSFSPFLDPDFTCPVVKNPGKKETPMWLTLFLGKEK